MPSYSEVRHCIRAQCTRAGIDVKSAHDILRTVASEMDRKGIQTEDIRWYLGHNDIATTRTYIMNNKGKQKTSIQIVNRDEWKRRTHGYSKLQKRKIARSLLK